jgi:hypothetical protein
MLILSTSQGPEEIVKQVLARRLGVSMLVLARKMAKEFTQLLLLRCHLYGCHERAGR